MIDFLFGQYRSYDTLDIVLELTAVFMGLISVWLAKKNNIGVFPTGIISTTIFIYLLGKWGLLGDMIINFYYTLMSLYGWYLWTRKNENQETNPISWMQPQEKIWALFLFLGTLIFVGFVYKFFGNFTSWTAYVDTFTTGLFFVGMWLMAKRKIENWIFWIVGDLVSVPLYFCKGYSFTGIQYFIFTIIAVFGFLEWKNIIDNNRQQL